jgi:hypothetical protein
MDVIHLSKESVAREMYGEPYTRLSAWAQQSVDHVIDRMERITLPNPALPNKEMTLERENEKLASELEQTKLENIDLWEENGELKAQVEEMKDQLEKVLKSRT